MHNISSEIEIMAPAGSFESLMAAIQCGADSVYFGIDQLNMRSRSSANFTTEDLKKIVRTCKFHGVKTYLTLNTVLFDADLPIMRNIVDAAAEAGVSAVIVSDQAALNYAFERGVEIHLSTQLNITNYETLKFYAKFADVVVLARELNMEQVAAIYLQISRDNLCGPSGQRIRIEMFCHGALCMATSGKCYLSLHEYNASANRGACMQLCRRNYTVTEKETGYQLDIENDYIMSPKDLKTIHFMNKMIDAGVRVFKIEGRARSADYVQTVVSCYREAADACIDGSFGTEKIENWNRRLSTVFNRGFWDGYYLGQKLGEWSHVYGSAATTRKVIVGRVTNYFPRLGVAEFLLESFTLSEGDAILVTGTTTGVYEATACDLRVNLQPVQTVTKGEKFSMAVSRKIRRNDKLYIIVPNK